MLNVNLNKNHTHISLLILLMALGASLRLYGLDMQSFWNDELSSWWRSSYDSLVDVIDKGVKKDVHPPGYQIFLYFVIKYIDDSEKVIRFPSAVAGIFSIPVTYLLGKKIYSYREGIIAASLISILWCPVYYSQEARSYSFLLLFILLSAYFWVSMIKNLYRGEKTYYEKFAYIGIAIITSYLHYYGTLFVALQGVFAALFLLNRPRTIIHIFIVYALILLAFIPWIPTMLSQLPGDPASWIPEPKISDFFLYLSFLFNYSPTLLFIILTLYGSLFFIHYYNFREKKVQFTSVLTSPTLLLTLWLLVPFAIAFIISLISNPILTNRNLIISLPAAYLLIARAITQLPINWKTQQIVTFFIIGFSLYHLIFIMGYYSKPYKTQFREAAEYVATEQSDYENSVILAYVWNPAYLEYYFHKKGFGQKVDLIAGEEKDIPRVSELINKKNPDFIWFINAHKSPSLKLINFLEDNFTLINHADFLGANIWLFRVVNKDIFP
jgi:mannosyltransferase